MNYERKVDSMDSLAGTQSFYDDEADNRRKRMLTIAAVALIAVVLLGETLTPRLALASVVVLAGAALATRAGTARR